MEVAYCGACPHPSALHRGGRGACRLNGCPCTKFADVAAPEPGVSAGPVPEVFSHRGWLWSVARVAAAFVAGVLVGLNL